MNGSDCVQSAVIVISYRPPAFELNQNCTMADFVIYKINCHQLHQCLIVIKMLSYIPTQSSEGILFKVRHTYTPTTHIFQHIVSMEVFAGFRSTENSQFLMSGTELRNNVKGNIKGY